MRTYQIAPGFNSATGMFDLAPRTGSFSQYSYQPGDRGALFGQQQAMLGQMYNPQQIEAQKQAMLQSAQQANLAGLQSRDLRSQQAEVSNTVRQGYQDAINSLTSWPGIADGSQKINQSLLSDLSEYSSILEQEVMAGRIEPGQAAMMLTNYPYAWESENQQPIYQNRA